MPASIHLSVDFGCSAGLADYECRKEWQEKDYKIRNQNELNNYDFTRRQLNFTVERLDGITRSAEVNSLNNTKVRFDQRLAELNFKCYYEGAANQPNNCVSVIISGDHELLTKLAYGDQPISFDKGADNSVIRRLPGIEQWACDTYDWACKMWGEANIVGYQVHMDEKTPHIHLTFIPVAVKKQRGRVSPGAARKTKLAVSYKGVFGETRSQRAKYMTDMHTSYHNDVGSKYGLARGRYYEDLTPEEQRARKHKSKAVLTAENEAKANITSLALQSEALQVKIEEQENRLSVKEQAKTAVDVISDVLVGRSRRRANEADRKAIAFKEKAEQIIMRVQSYEAKLKDEAAVMQGFYETNKNKIEDYDRKTEENTSLRRQLNEAKSANTNRDYLIEKFVSYGAIHREQWSALFNGEVVVSHEVRVNDVAVDLDHPMKLRLMNGRNLEIHDQHWVSEQGFWTGIRKGITAVFDMGSRAYQWVLQQLNIGHGLSR